MTTLNFHQRKMLVADESMGQLLSVAKRAANSGASVLLCGESGTGKELIARFIHEMSVRSEKPFISVNCAAIPDGLMEAELFGFEKGAFTGALAQRIGKFERAQGGTLLLDEVSEMPIALQAKLLRVLQEAEIDRLGGKEPVQIDTRIIATTNRDPLSLIQQGTFREDLYFRLNVLRIDCQPLRGRREAILNLAEFFLEALKERYERPELKLTAGARDKLSSHSWPGNIRELSNAIERSSLLVESNSIEAEDIQFLLPVGRLETSMDQPAQSLAQLEQKHIENTLKGLEGNRTEAAKRLGISVRTLRNKLKEYQTAG